MHLHSIADAAEKMKKISTLSAHHAVAAATF
jgi:hypothetical protein